MKKTSSELVLLDVNVLLALAWPNHQFHRVATRRLDRGQERWATCALTELGFIRLSSNPAAVAPAKTPADAARLLATMTRDPRHAYLDRLASPAGLDFGKVLGHNQLTDAYLLALARRHEAAFLTFDTRLRGLAQGAQLEILGVTRTDRSPGTSADTVR
ncbi:MAG TPA: TA system VapC family ribonuclease toxin [Bryobacteraceae bacterium]|nr:TA system VapC family ribonuclease toxin [Bryobacteraceae bacterium]